MNHTRADQLEAEKFKKVVYVYILKSDLERIYDGCDLGDSVQVSAYQYPHKRYQEPDMVRFEAHAESKRGLSESEKANVDAIRNHPNKVSGRVECLLAIIDRLTNQKEQVGG